MSVTFARLAAMVAPLALGLIGCNQYGSTNNPAAPVTRPPAAGPADEGHVHVDAGQSGGVNVDVNPGQGVNVDVEGEPLRERIRERRAERGAPVVAPPAP